MKKKDYQLRLTFSSPGDIEYLSVSNVTLNTVKKEIKQMLKGPFEDIRKIEYWEIEGR